MLKWISFFSLLFILGIVTGCSNDYRPVLSDKIVKFSSTHKPVYSRATIAASSQARDIECIVHGFGDDVVLFIASIHGNEKTGTFLLEALDTHLKSHPDILINKEVVIVPIVNPDGFAANRRFNSSGIDLNRNFPASNRINNKVNGLHCLSEPESRAIDLVMHTYKPNRIITFHQPLNCIDYDGPAKELAHLLSKKCELKVKKLGARAGSLGAYAGDCLGIPIVTIEFPDETKQLSQAQLWQRYNKLVLAAIKGD